MRVAVCCGAEDRDAASHEARGAAFLEQAIAELMIVREEKRRQLEQYPDVSDEDKAYEVGNWDRIITRLKQLRDEAGWEADFG